MKLSLASLFLAMAPLMAAPVSVQALDVRAAAKASLADRRLQSLYADVAVDPAKDVKRARMAGILISLDDEDHVPFLVANSIKVDLGVMPQGSMAVIKDNKITVNIMASSYSQYAAITNAIDFIKGQKKDGLPHQPACFNAGYNFNSGLKLIPAGC